MTHTIYFFHNVSSIDDLLARLKDFDTGDTRNSEVAVMLDEFDLQVDEVISRTREISQIVQRQGLDLIMAPGNPSKDTHYHGIRKHLPGYNPSIDKILWDIDESSKQKTDPNYEPKTYDPEQIVTQDIFCKASWETYSELFQSNGITPETVISPNAERIDSIAIFFGRDGNNFAFPKLWENSPIHIVPNRNIGITICGEVNYLTSDKTQGLSIIYNPSRERDDIQLTQRMNVIANRTDKETDRQNSTYVKAPIEVPVIRCDCGLDGILNPRPSNIQILKYEQRNFNITQLSIDSMKTLTVQEIRDEVEKYQKPYCSFFSVPVPELHAVKKLIENKNDLETITYYDFKSAISAVANERGAKCYREQLLNQPNNPMQTLTGIDFVLKNIAEQYLADDCPEATSHMSKKV